ncbi:MAG: hypothetical protein H7Y04_04860 [Verrucomicrobia bacterium]|nr:hypothetical protein [Cytophagales bacterium]
MALTLNLLQTQADCDKVLADLNQTQQTLQFNRLRFERSKDTATQRATGIDADIASNQAEVSSLAPVVASLPESDIKAQLQGRLRRAEFNLANLQERKLRSGATAVILLESQINETDSRLNVLNTDITQVETHKGTLPA